MFDLSKLKDLSEWQKARGMIETAVKDLLGSLPKERAELQPKTLEEDEFPGYVRHRVSYFVDDWERVPAWLFVPDGKEEVPAILCCHDRAPQGKDEPAGIEGDASLAFARRYAEMGYVTLAPDTIAAGERVSCGLDPFDTTNVYKDHPKMTAHGKMLADHAHAIDLLCDIKRVDPARIGVVGHGLGGTNALFLASFDERVQACVSSCGFTRFADDSRPDRWVLDSGLAGLPKLEKCIQKGEYPFDWEHVLALVAPNPTLVLTALNDEVLARTKSCGKAVKLASRVYRLLGEENALSHAEHRDGRRLTQDGLAQIDEWFERWL